MRSNPPLWFLAILVFAVLSTAKAAIVVTAPTQDDSVELTTPFNVTWTGAGSGTVRIDLYKAGVFQSTLASAQAGGGTNGGVYAWTPASTLTRATDYTLRVVDEANTATYGESGMFSLIAPLMKILSPNGGESIITPVTINIKWLSRLGGAVKVEVIHSATGQVDVLNSLTPNSGIYYWLSPFDLTTPAGDYRIRITSVDNPSISDTSDGDFCLTTNGYNKAVTPKATVQSSPSPAITVTWPPWSVSGATGWKVYRKSPSSSSWGTALADLPLSTTSWTDTGVVTGVAYDYRVDRVASLSATATGYVESGIDLPLVDDRGKVVLIVDQTYAEPLAVELARYVQDLIGDGWQVIRHDVSASDTPAAIKALIQADYNQDPAHVKSVILFGRVPVLRTGYASPDGHSARAMSCDGYYGDMTTPTLWTDTYASGSSWVAGDGVLDQNYFPSPITLAVGRVDLTGMTSFSLSATELHRQYLNKVHNYRVKQMTAPNRAVLDDGFPTASHSATGWRTWGTLADTIVSGNWNTVLPTNSYLFAYGCGSGGIASADYVATTTDFQTYDPKAIFTMLFGSYFWEFQYDNSLLRAPLATSMGLTCVWAGFQEWFFQPLAMGETFGECNRRTQNGAPYASGSSSRLAYMSLMGDPTLRLHVVSPPSNAMLSGNTLSWTASADDNVIGYHIYQAASDEGPFTRLSSTPVVGTSYTVPDTGLVYMVRAIKRETSVSGTYYNASQGVLSSALHVRISPGEGSPVKVAYGRTRQFVATVYDADFAIISPPPAISWSVSGGGAITSDGTFTAGDYPGVYTVSATTGGASYSRSVEVVPYPSDYVAGGDGFDYSAWSSGAVPMNTTWSLASGSSAPGIYSTTDGDAYVQLNNVVLSRALDNTPTDSFDFEVDVLPGAYSSFLWIGLFNQAGTEGYGFSWDSSLSTLNNGCGVMAIRKYAVSSLAFNTTGTLLGSAKNSGHVVNTLPFARVRLSWRKDTGTLSLYVDGRLLSSVQNETSYSSFSRVYLGGFNYSRFANIRLTIPYNLRTWRLANALPEDGTGAGAPDADPDGDGLPNLVEYAIGSNPMAAGSGQELLPRAEAVSANALGLSFTRNCDDLDYTVQSSEDLSTWVPMIVNPGSSGEHVTVEQTIPAAGRLFLRLSVSEKQ